MLSTKHFRVQNLYAFSQTAQIYASALLRLVSNVNYIVKNIHTRAKSEAHQPSFGS